MLYVLCSGILYLLTSILPVSSPALRGRGWLKAVSCRHALLGNWDVDNVYFPLPSIVLCSLPCTASQRRHQTSVPSRQHLPRPLVCGRARNSNRLLSGRKRTSHEPAKRTRKMVCVGVRKSWRGLITDDAASFI